VGKIPWSYFEGEDDHTNLLNPDPKFSCRHTWNNHIFKKTEESINWCFILCPSREHYLFYVSRL